VHVLITADTIGGVWTYTRELASGLLDRGHRVTVVSFGGLPSAAQVSWIDARRITYYPTVFPLEWMQDAEAGIRESARHLARIIDQCRPDVLHLSQFCYGALEVGIPKVVVAHSDVRTWWKAVHSDDPPATGWFDWYTSLVLKGVACADALVTPSRWMLDQLREHYELPSQCRVIYNGRDPALFCSSRRKANTVLSVGRTWDEAKQIQLLLARRQCVPIGIAGSANHPDRTFSHSPALEFTGNYTFWGEQDESHLCALYADASTYAATSRYEPFGLAPVEAALSRCALIANDIPVFRELWRDAAVFFKRNDPDSLAGSIGVLSRSESLRDQFAEKAFVHARERYDSARMVTEYEQLYRSLTGGESD
jgi:glycogen(starch) synthase